MAGERRGKERGARCNRAGEEEETSAREECAWQPTHPRYNVYVQHVHALMVLLLLRSAPFRKEFALRQRRRPSPSASPAACPARERRATFAHQR